MGGCVNIMGSCLSFQIKVQILAFYTNVCTAPWRETCFPDRSQSCWKMPWFDIFAIAIHGIKTTFQAISVPCFPRTSFHCNKHQFTGRYFARIRLTGFVPVLRVRFYTTTSPQLKIPGIATSQFILHCKDQIIQWRQLSLSLCVESWQAIPTG